MTDSYNIVTTREAPTPGGHYSQAIAARSLVFVSGQLPLDATGRIPEGADFEAQIKIALNNLLAILRGAGGAPSDVVKVTAYIVGVERWPEFNRVYAQVFGHHKPARSVVPVGVLHHGCLVEIEAIAVVPEEGRVQSELQSRAVPADVSTWEFALHRNGRAAQRGMYPFTGTLSVAEGKRAYEDIRQWQGYAPTPLRDLAGIALRTGVGRVLYKDEASRFGLGSFKALGGAYAVACLLQNVLSEQLGRKMTRDELTSPDHAALTRRITVACASDGNHGRSVAAGAKRFGCNCTIFLHEGVSVGREKAIADLGASIVRIPGNYDDSVRAAAQTSRALGWYVVADTSDEPADPTPALVMHGYATLVIEALQQLRASGEALPTHVFLQGGVGGLAAAVVAYLWEELGPSRAPVFVVVEPRRADCLYQSAVNGRPTSAKGDLNTLMAGLSCGEVSRVAWPILEAGVEFFMTIDDRAAVECMRLLRRSHQSGGSIIAGESGVAGLAGLLATARDPSGDGLRRLRLDASSTVLLVGTEGATDPDIYETLTAPGDPAFPGKSVAY